MVVNFKKLKEQVKKFKPEGKNGYIFIATDEQKRNGIYSIAKQGSKRGLIACLVEFIKDEEDFKKEFSL